MRQEVTIVDFKTRGKDMNELTSRLTQFSAIDELKALGLAKGYLLEEVAIATGLTVSEVQQAEKGYGQPRHVDRTRNVLE